MANNEKSGIALFAGVVLGGLIGAAAGMLLAPQPGSKTRKQIVSKLNAIKENGQEALEKFKEERIDPAVANLKQSVEKEANRIKSSVSEQVKQIQNDIRSKTK